MTDKLILAIDQGTTSTRALIFNARGDVVAIAQKELEIFTPQSGWVEQDANQIWEDVQSTCREAMAQVDINHVIGIGITNQRETTLIWDRETGEPVYNAIVWQDRRTADFCKSIKLHEADIQARSGLLADPYFSATKIRWILENTDAAHNNLLFGTIDCYLLWKLTNGGVHATDISNASRTMLMNIQTHEWDADQCEMMDVPMGMLPEIKDNCTEFGICELFDKPLPILAMAGDQQAATFGQACFERGMVKSTYGTGCFALMNTGLTCQFSTHKLLSTVAWRIAGKATYALEGSIFVAGAAVQFLRDNLELFDDAAESEAIATSVEDSQGVVFVPAFTGLGAPYWNPNARGMISGLSRGTSIAHITRAALEAQAFQTRDLIGAFAEDTNTTIQAIRVDGGLANNDFVCQQIANQTSAQIDRPMNTEATAWGVAAMAFLQAGVFNTLDDVAATYAREKQFTSDGNHDRNNHLYENWKQAIKMVGG
jgi:glycerol kinase